MIETKDLAWAAGLFEGEGSIEYASKRAYPRLHLAMTDLDVVIRYAAIIGAPNVRTRKVPGKPMWTCRVGGQRAIQLLMTFYCLLGERRQAQVREALQKWKDNEQPRADVWARRRREKETLQKTIVWQRLPAGALA